MNESFLFYHTSFFVFLFNKKTRRSGLELLLLENTGFFMLIPSFANSHFPEDPAHCKADKGGDEPGKAELT